MREPFGLCIPAAGLMPGHLLSANLGERLLALLAGVCTPAVVPDIDNSGLFLLLLHPVACVQINPKRSLLFKVNEGRDLHAETSGC